MAFIVSDFYDTAYERSLALALAAVAESTTSSPSCSAIPATTDLPDVWAPASFEDLESGESIVVDTSDPRVRAW